MDSQYAEPLDLDAIAREAGYSRYHFVRAFGAAYGESPGRYLTRRRIERAQDLLRSVTLTVTESCHLVGFSSLGSFSSRFRELTGRSPSEYQRAAHRDAPPPRVDPAYGAYLRAKAAADKDLRSRDLDWTILRPGRLNNHPGTGLVRLGASVGYGEVPRDDVASVLVALLDEPRTSGKTLELVSGGRPITSAIRSVVAS